MDISAAEADSAPPPSATPERKRGLFGPLWLQVLVAVVVGVLLGVDRFTNAARAITNIIGNGVATIVVAKWEGAVDAGRAARVLNGLEDA